VASVHNLAEAVEEVGGWSLRRAAATLGLDHVRVLRWQTRAGLGRLDDARPGPDTRLHALLGWEKDAIVKLAEEWGEVDRSHRKLAHRGSRLDLVHVSESTVLRVLVAAGLHLPALPGREPRPARMWPAWADLVPGVIWIYDFTHFRASKWCAVAVTGSGCTPASASSPPTTNTKDEVTRSAKTAASHGRPHHPVSRPGRPRQGHRCLFQGEPGLMVGSPTAAAAARSRWS
jgi:putative transposase